MAKNKQYLNCEEYDLENISHNHKTVEDCCRVMFTQWCKGRIGDEPHTWGAGYFRTDLIFVQRLRVEN